MPNHVFLFSPFPFQGFKIDINCKQLTVDFVNQSVLQISSQDVESKRSDKTDFAEQLGAMNKSWQILQGLVTEKVSQRPLLSLYMKTPRTGMLYKENSFHRWYGDSWHMNASEENAPDTYLTLNIL